MGRPRSVARWRGRARCRLALVEKNGSSTRSRSAGAMPHPVSAMTIRSSGPAASMLTLARPAGPSDWAALSSRLRKSCSSAIASPSTHAGDAPLGTWSIVPPCAANVASALCAAARKHGCQLNASSRRLAAPRRAQRSAHGRIQPLHILQCTPDQRPRRRVCRRFFLGPLQVHANGRQAVADLVRQRRGVLAHGRERLSLRQLAEGAAEVLRHAVERGSDPAHLVGAAPVHLMFEIACRDGVRRDGQALQRSGEPCREEGRQEQHDE